jgi:peptide/nickel transport system permease protein
VSGARHSLRRYLVRRFVTSLVVMLGVTTIVFLLQRLIPGDPVEIYLGEQATAVDKERLRKERHLDEPLVVQFGYFLKSVADGSLGRPLYQKGRTVSELIFRRYPATLRLAGAAILVAILIALPLGVLAALKQHTLFDHLAMTVSLLGIAVPVFWLGPLLLLLFAVKLGWLPVSGDEEGLRSLILPAITIGLALAAMLSRMTRASMLEVIREDYVTTARMKGVSERAVIWKHALRNATIPILTVLGVQFGTALGGAVITENVFGWPGIGTLLIESIRARDYDVVQGCVLVISASYVVVNLLTDLVYAWVDPRVRLG